MNTKKFASLLIAAQFWWCMALAQNQTTLLKQGIRFPDGTLQAVASLDNDSTNELQQISISTDTIYLTDGGFAVLPPGFVDTDEQVLNLSNDTLYISNGNFVVLPSGGSSGWSLTGNAGTVSGTNFIGTTDAQALDFRTNDTLRVRFSTKGQIEILNTGQSVFIGEAAGANDDRANRQNVFVGFQAGYSNTTGAASTAYGYNTLYSNETGFGNTAIGYQALQSTTAGSNVAVGYQALLSNTTGYQNTAIGMSTLVQNTTGINNTALGTSALNLNSTGGNNTASGNASLSQNTTGSNNTGNGALSLSSNTIGSDNTAIGFEALTSNTEGIRNAALGNTVLHSNTTGNQNTAIGMGALYWNTTGSENTVSGYQTMLNNTIGNQNVAYGQEALLSNTTGSSNTAIGYQALSSNTTGTNNIALGISANVGSGALSNAIAIGYRARVDADNCMVLGSINGVNGGTASVNVGIGVNAPTASLHVNGTLRLQGMGEAAGKVLTSDANGNATWQTAAGSGWSLTGNAGTNPSNNFIGTTDNQALVMRTNNSDVLRLTTKGQIETLNSSKSVWLGEGAGTNDVTSNAYNVSIGYQAGLTGGYTSVAIGYQTLKNSNTGPNVAIGTSALSASTSGYENTATGPYALSANTSGFANVANGAYALLGNTTAGENVAVGDGALHNQSFSNAGSAWSSENVAIGYQALYSNQPTSTTNGNQNTGVGNSALSVNTTGKSLTALGYSANVGSSGLTNATAIGANAQVDASNTIVLGSVSGVNSATSSVNVGIGINAPKSTLEVVGGFATKISTQAGSSAVTLDNTAAVWYFTGSASVTLPAANSSPNRRYTIVNRSASARTTSSFNNLSGVATTSIAGNSSVEIISDGTNWLQIK